MDYDAIVIGAGLGGCAAGATLAGGGKKVLILERMDTIGGRCSSQEREGFKLDIGSHGIMLAEYGSFTEALRRVGKENAVEWHHITEQLIVHSDTALRVTQDKITVTNKDSTVEINLKGVAKLQQMMKPRLSAGRQAGIKGMMTSVAMRMAQAVMRMMTPLAKRVIARMVPVVLRKIWEVIAQFDEVSFKDFMDQIIKWDKFRDILELTQFAGYGTPSWMTAVSEFMRTMVPDQYLQPGELPKVAVGYPKGGLISIPKALCEGIIEHGGEVRTGVNVKKVIVEGGKAVGVELDNGEIINAPVIVSNAGIKETVSDMVGEDKFDAEYAKTVRDLVIGVAPFTLRAALDKKITDVEFGFSIPVGGLEEYYHKLWDDREIPDVPPPIMFSSPSNMDPSLVPEGKQLIIAIGALNYDSREDYKKMEPLAIESVDHAFPGFKEHMIWYDFLTPETYIAFGEKKAPAIGIAQCIGQVGEKRPSSVSPVPGLYFVGGEAGRNISGIATEMCVHSGIVCVDYILKNKPVLKSETAGTAVKNSMIDQEKEKVF
ncbi:MAG: NAD(P)/FAD-dependent oxidoreductase [Actinobacteria bacterium]|nr:NAD(P)/FAD-dependent oxidoreductase [Actinomycetota bacterium]